MMEKMETRQRLQDSWLCTLALTLVITQEIETSAWTILYFYLEKKCTSLQTKYEYTQCFQQVVWSKQFLDATSTIIGTHIRKEKPVNISIPKLFKFYTVIGYLTFGLYSDQKFSKWLPGVYNELLLVNGTSLKVTPSAVKNIIQQYTMLSQYDQTLKVASIYTRCKIFFFLWL